MAKFKWLWYDVTSYEHYFEESKFDEPVINNGNELFVKGIIAVLNNLSPKSKGIFKVLAQYQLDNPQSNGLTYNSFYEKCRDAFLVNSELTMRSQLTEFKDHKIILFKNGKDGGYFFIPATTTMLQQIVEDHLSNTNR